MVIIIKKFLLFFYLVFYITISSGCYFNVDSRSEKKESSQDVNKEWIGDYQGIQEEYFLKNNLGDYIEIRGEKVKVPSSHFLFKIEGNGNARLIQTNREDNKEYLYYGPYKILSKIPNKVVLEILLSDGQSSSPKYVLEIDNTKNKVICSDNNSPVFYLSKTLLILNHEKDYFIYFRYHYCYYSRMC